jgi:glycosyltransferase involved in cell wall biosynthesis
MLFIYGALGLGGVETFFVRMAKERFKLGLTTKILLLGHPKNNNKNLLNEMKKYAKVYFAEDVFKVPLIVSRIFPLHSPVRLKKLEEMMSGITQMHATDGMRLLLANRFNEILKTYTPITVGFYHYTTFTWSRWDLAYHELISRKFVFQFLPKRSLMFFSQDNLVFHHKCLGVDLDGANTFRLGVVDRQKVVSTVNLNIPLRIVTVGRLVGFKTYIFLMLDVVKSLNNQGVRVSYDIYGYGSDKDKINQRIKDLNLENSVRLMGKLEYEFFDSVVKKYDLFIGSGTAIIQAAALGVPSIVGIENMVEPKTYGYFCDTYNYEYNLKGLDLPLIDIEKMILKFLDMAQEERKFVQKKHIESIESFTNESCCKFMEELKNIRMPKQEFKYNKILYACSRVFYEINVRFNKNHPFNTRNETYKDRN